MLAGLGGRAGDEDAAAELELEDDVAPETGQEGAAAAREAPPPAPAFSHGLGGAAAGMV